MKKAERVKETEGGAEAKESEEEAPVEEIEAEEELEEIREVAEEEISEEAAEEKPEEEAEEIKPEIVEERIYTIPLGRAWVAPRRKRAPRAVRLVREFIERHMKTGGGTGEEEDAGRLVISNEVNEKIWSRGIEKPPRRIRVRVAKDVEGTVTVYLAEGD